MAPYVTKVKVLAFLLIAATFSTSTWAMRDLVKLGNFIDSPTTTEFVPASSIDMTQDGAPADFHTQPIVIHGGRSNLVEVPRALMGCRGEDISITQHPVVGHPGIPRFEVQIANTCVDHACSIRNIIANCGEFTSATLIDPNLFRRVGDGPTCIVNNSQPMTSGQIITFDYDTEFMEPIRFSSAEPVC